MAKRKKAFRIIGLLAALLVVAGVVLYTVLSIDDPPPDVDDLRVQRLDIGPAENGFVIFGQAVAKLDLNLDAPVADDRPPAPKGEPAEPSDKPQTRLERFNRMSNGLEWDAALAEEVLARNVEAIALWEKAVAAPHFQGPEVRSIEDVLVPVHSWFCIARLVSVRARARVKQGNCAAAFDDLVSVVRFGQRIEHSKGSMVTWQVGGSIKDDGCALMRQMLSEGTLTPQQLRAYARQIAAFAADTGGYADAFRNEYTIRAAFIDDAASGKTPVRGTTGEPREGVSRWFWQAACKPFFKPNRTKALLAEIARGCGENGSKYFKDSLEYVFDDEEAGLGAGKYNGVGVVFARLLTGSGSGMPAVKCRENVGLAVTRVLLAAKAYRMEKRRLPERLDELVPDYLDSVPVDDFDGKPLRYNPAKKVLYSVGKDLKDDGGMTKQEYVEFQRKERRANEMLGDPDDVKDIENEYPLRAPDLLFPIEF